MSAKFNAKEVAEKFKSECLRMGWQWSGNGSVVTIWKNFIPGSNSAFVECDGEYGYLLSIIPRTQLGSIWGTDGGGIGALSAIQSGVFTEHKSGCAKSVIRLL